MYFCFNCVRLSDFFFVRKVLYSSLKGWKIVLISKLLSNSNMLKQAKYLDILRFHANVSKSHQSMVRMEDAHRNGGRGHGYDHVRDLEMAEVALQVFSLARNPMVVYQWFVAWHLMVDLAHYRPYLYYRCHHPYLVQDFPAYYPFVDWTEDQVWEPMGPDRLDNLWVQMVVADSLKQKLVFVQHQAVHPVVDMMLQCLAGMHTNLWAVCSLHQLRVSDY